MNKKKIFLATLVLPIIFLFFSNPVNATPKSTLIMGIHAEPGTLDPGDSKDIVAQMIQFQIFDTLVKKSSTDSRKVIPALAESWKFNDDNTEIAFTIRNGVKFHNGDLMTMDDVMFSLNRALSSSFTAGYNDPVAGFDRIDEKTVLMKLKYPYAPVMDIITNVSFSILSEKAFKEAKSQGIDFGRNPIGTGPYKFLEWQSGNRLVFDAFDEYYAGSPKIKKLTFRIMTDQGTAALSLRRGEIDALNMAKVTDWEYLDTLKNIHFLDCGSDHTIFIVFNCKEGIFTNPLLRKAVSYAINREDIILGGNNGYGEANECLTPTTAFGYIPEFKHNPYDSTQAKKLIEDAGYPKGFNVKLRVNQADVYVKPAEVVQDQLRKVGIILDFDKMERGAYLSDVVGSSKFEIAVHMVNATVGDADNVLTRKLHSSMTENGNNYSKYINHDVDKLIERARIESNPEKRLEYYEEIYKVIREECPIIPLFSGSNRIYLDNKIKGANPQVAFQYRINEWYWNEE